METQDLKGLLATCSEPENANSEIPGGASLLDTPTVSLQKDEASMDAIIEQGKADGKAKYKEGKTDRSSKECDSTRKETNTELLNEKMASCLPANIEGEPHDVVNNNVASIVSEVIEETSTMLVDGHDKANEVVKIEEIQPDNSFEVENSSSNKKTKKILRTRKKKPEESPTFSVNTVSTPAKMMKKKMNGANTVILKGAKPVVKCSKGNAKEIKGDVKLKSIRNDFTAEVKKESKGIEDVKSDKKVEGSMNKKVKVMERKRLVANATGASTNTKSVAVPSVEKMDVEDSKDDAYVKTSVVTGGGDRIVKSEKIVKKVVGAAQKNVKKNKLVANAKSGNTNSDSPPAKVRTAEVVAAMIASGDISKRTNDKQEVKVGNLAFETANAVTAAERLDAEDAKVDANVEEKESIAPVQNDNSIRKRKRPINNTSSLNAGMPINPVKPSSSDADERTRKADSADKRLKKADGMGLIFMCNAKTKRDCYKYKILGLPESKKDIVAKIYKGMRLFLFDVDSKLMYGIYKATSRGGYNIEPKAFASKYPSQVCFTIWSDSLPLCEDEFKAVIKENYYERHKFDCQLSPEQVQKLCKLFQMQTARASTGKRRGGPHREMIAPSSRTRERKRRPTRHFGRTHTAKYYTFTRKAYPSPPHQYPSPLPPPRQLRVVSPPPPPSRIYEQPISDSHYEGEHHAVFDREMQPRDVVVEYQVPRVFYREPVSYHEPLHHSRLPPKYSPPHRRPPSPHFYRY
ncbi:B2 protein [Apostasia shenzhenica]|uniref:B2 protein n=1 Tax=Apostasia shenzhenica TaxID=1088818 RepID=A0A2H9ZZ58_9ASPA|nr:B2 protein [Apostasia shenzhenica]